MCNGLDAISSGGVSTGTGFRSVAKPDLHSAMLVVNAQTSVAGIVTCWKGIDLVGTVSWFGVKKMGDQKTYFVVMQDNFNELHVYRRRPVTSCHTISPLFLHIKN